MKSGPPSETDGTNSDVARLLTLETDSGQPLHRQIYEQVRKAVISDKLTEGTEMPSSRALAASLGISRNTVLQAYDQTLKILDR